ncbi:MAG: hypothetical protein WCJ30_19370 [Deltaproteobacteria bacterium]
MRLYGARTIELPCATVTEGTSIATDALSPRVIVRRVVAPSTAGSTRMASPSGRVPALAANGARVHEPAPSGCDTGSTLAGRSRARAASMSRWTRVSISARAWPPSRSAWHCPRSSSVVSRTRRVVPSEATSTMATWANVESTVGDRST